jgi:hypothetical protein
MVTGGLTACGEVRPTIGGQPRRGSLEEGHPALIDLVEDGWR